MLTESFISKEQLGLILEAYAFGTSKEDTKNRIFRSKEDSDMLYLVKLGLFLEPFSTGYTEDVNGVFFLSPKGRAFVKLIHAGACLA